MIDSTKCVYCGMCARKCPAHAITVLSQDGKNLASVSTDYCIGCGVCEDVCPLPDAPAIKVSGVSEQIRVLPPIQLDCAETLAPAEQNDDAEQNAAEGEQKADGEQSAAASSKPVAVPVPELCGGGKLLPEKVLLFRRELSKPFSW